MNPSINLFEPLLMKCKEHIIASKSTMNIQEKSGSDLVTNIDVEIEQMIIAHIHKHFPEDLIIAEETAIEKLTNKPTWVIDPIDGTVNFSYGSKLYGIQFCRMIEQEAVFTVLYLPELDDLFYAIKGHGAYHNGRQMHRHPSIPLNLSQVSFGDFSKSSYASRPYEMRLIDVLKDDVLKIRLFGSSCMDFTALASGQTHCHIMFSKRIWEFSSGLLLLKETGLHIKRITVKGTNIEAICGAHNIELLHHIEEILNH